MFGLMNWSLTSLSSTYISGRTIVVVIRIKNKGGGGSDAVVKLLDLTLLHKVISSTPSYEFLTLI
jgi:hypothetical protein